MRQQGSGHAVPEKVCANCTPTASKKQKGGGIHLPVVALTAFAMKTDQERCLAAGMDEYLSKPIRGQDLDDILEKYVMRRMKTGRPNT